MSGVAGRTNYSEWNKKTNSLLSELEEEEKREIQESKAALGQDGRYAYSKSEADERVKLKEVSKAREALDAYKERELGVVQVLHSLLDGDEKGQDAKTKEEAKIDTEGAEEKQDGREGGRHNVSTRFVTR